MRFTCHMVSDGHPYNGKCIGWAVAGNGRLWRAPYLNAAQGKCLKEFPNAIFDEGVGVDEGEEDLLINGEDEYWEYIRNGRIRKAP